MSHSNEPQERLRWARRLALAITVPWAVWWTYFSIASTLGGGLDLRQIITQITVPGLLFLAIAAIAYRWEAIGGALQVAVGSLVLTAYPSLMYGTLDAGAILWVLMTMALPALAAGWLFLWHWWRNRDESQGQPSD